MTPMNASHINLHREVNQIWKFKFQLKLYLFTANVNLSFYAKQILQIPVSIHDLLSDNQSIINI